MIDLANSVFASNESSLKLYMEGSGTLSVTGIGGVGNALSTATIAHGYGSDVLLWQVASSSGYATGTIMPWMSNDGRLKLFARLDSTNLYILARVEDSSGSGFPGFTLDYSYRILIP